MAVCISAGVMAALLLAAPFFITSPVSAIIIFGITRFGYTSYTANLLACPADIVPASATATVWGLGCIGTGIGGALFNFLSGRTLKLVTSTQDYTSGYN